jgi:hypothetical protein
MSRRRKHRDTLYFAYGSNLHVEQMQARCPDAEMVASAKLPGFRLVFRGVADIQERDRAVCYGAVWKISRRDEDALDRYEGYPYLYGKRYVAVVLEDGTTAVALTYQMFRRDRYMPPSRGYLATIIHGYKAWGIPRDSLSRAVRRSYDSLAKRGITKVRESGKRMVPVYDRPRMPEIVGIDWDDYDLTRMSPATRLEMVLEAEDAADGIDEDGGVTAHAHRDGKVVPLRGRRIG